MIIENLLITAASLNENDIEELKQRVNKAMGIREFDYQACRLLAFCHYTGINSLVPKDLKEAAGFLQLGAQKQDPVCQGFYGAMLLENPTVLESSGADGLKNLRFDKNKITEKAMSYIKQSFGKKCEIGLYYYGQFGFDTAKNIGNQTAMLKFVEYILQAARGGFTVAIEKIIEILKSKIGFAYTDAQYEEACLSWEKILELNKTILGLLKQNLGDARGQENNPGIFSPAPKTPLCKFQSSDPRTDFYPGNSDHWSSLAPLSDASKTCEPSDGWDLIPTNLNFDEVEQTDTTTSNLGFDKKNSQYRLSFKEAAHRGMHYLENLSQNQKVCGTVFVTAVFLGWIFSGRKPEPFKVIINTFQSSHSVPGLSRS